MVSVLFLDDFLSFVCLLYWLSGLIFYVFRFLESHWFVWATQMSHIPMYVDYDQKRDWVTTQVMASCNIEQSWFNDWWSGHLNFQIEHQWVGKLFTLAVDVISQSSGNFWLKLCLKCCWCCCYSLFPTMPRHNLVKVAPLVKSLCQKYNLEYTNKPLLTAFSDIVKWVVTLWLYLICHLRFVILMAIFSQLLSLITANLTHNDEHWLTDIKRCTAVRHVKSKCLMSSSLVWPLHTG